MSRSRSSAAPEPRSECPLTAVVGVDEAKPGLAGGLGREVKPTEDEVVATQIADQMERITQQQQQFERHLARRLAVDAVGLAAVEHLIRAGDSTPSELSRELGISTAAMTLVLDRLAAAGHVTRQPHPTDRRKVVITPATTTAAAAQALVDPLITAVNTLTSSLTRQERETISTFLGAMLDVYDGVLAKEQSNGRSSA